MFWCKMEINRNNYEIFFLDYLDGTLSEKEIDCFLDFVRKNPDLQQELEDLDKFKLPEQTVRFNAKNKLYKKKEELPAENYTAIAYLEGDLSQAESAEFLHLLKFQPQQEKELELLAKTRLIADQTIVFPNKKSLYKKTLQRKLWYYSSAIAAILLISLAIAPVFQFHSSTEKTLKQPQFAEVKKEIPEEKTIETAAISSQNIENEKTNRDQTEQAVVQAKIKTSQQVIQEEKTPEPVQHEYMETIRPMQARIRPLEKQENMQLAVISTPAQKEESKTETYTLNEYLAEKVLKIKRDHNSNEGSFLEAGIRLASKASGNRIRYESEDGHLTKFSVDTRLLAFSVPLK